MDLTQMRYVTAIAALGNMTKAAETQHISQSALSLSCKRLEKELGVALFAREGRHLRLTPAGELFCKRASRILRLADEMETELKAYSYHRTVLFGSEVIDFSNELITLCRRLEPDLEVQANNSAQHSIVPKLRSGEYSFALTLAPLAEEDMESTLLVDEPMLVLMGSSSHLCEKSELVMADLDGAPLVTTSSEYRIGELMRSYFTDAGITIRKFNLVGDSDSIVIKVYNEFGVSFVPETVVNFWIRTPESFIPGVRWRPVKDALCRRRIYLTRLRNKKSNPACDAFLHFLSSYCAAVRKHHVFPTQEEIAPFL